MCFFVLMFLDIYVFNIIICVCILFIYSFIFRPDFSFFFLFVFFSVFDTGSDQIFFPGVGLGYQIGAACVLMYSSKLFMKIQEAIDSICK